MVNKTKTPGSQARFPVVQPLQGGTLPKWENRPGSHRRCGRRPFTPLPGPEQETFVRPLEILHFKSVRPPSGVPVNIPTSREYHAGFRVFRHKACSSRSGESSRDPPRDVPGTFVPSRRRDIKGQSLHCSQICHAVNHGVHAATTPHHPSIGGRRAGKG